MPPSTFESLLLSTIDLSKTLECNSLFVFTQPNFVAWFREVFVTAGPFQHTLKKRWKEFLRLDWETLGGDTCDTDSELHDHIVYVLQNVQKFETTSNYQIRQWASAAREILSNKTTVKAFTAIIKHDEQMKSFVSSGLSLMTSECIRSNCIFMPYDAIKKI